jgi:hypothetical protein
MPLTIDRNLERGSCLEKQKTRASADFLGVQPLSDKGCADVLPAEHYISVQQALRRRSQAELSADRTANQPERTTGDDRSR